ncbi:MAG: N-acetyltransferase [Pseudomonadota bacterium]
MSKPTIRFDKPTDWPRIEAIFHAAFGSDAEFQLLQRLREDGDLGFLLTAENDGDVVGGAAFSELPIDGPEAIVRAAALAPIGVAPEQQAGGVGAALIRAGLAQCRKKGFEAVIVLGYPTYYRRFGFSAAAAEHIEAPWSGPNLMAVALDDETPPLVGVARYPAAFSVEVKPES